jgi:hypothetical protein
MTGTEIAVRAGNALEKRPRRLTKLLVNLVARLNLKCTNLLLWVSGSPCPPPGYPQAPIAPTLEEIFGLPNNRAVNRGEGTSALRDLSLAGPNLEDHSKL